MVAVEGTISVVLEVIMIIAVADLYAITRQNIVYPIPFQSPQSKAAVRVMRTATLVVVV